MNLLLLPLYNLSLDSFINHNTFNLYIYIYRERRERGGKRDKLYTFILSLSF